MKLLHQENVRAAKDQQSSGTPLALLSLSCLKRVTAKAFQPPNPVLTGAFLLFTLEPEDGYLWQLLLTALTQYVLPVLKWTFIPAN
jgi:hypothetical protein